LPERDRRQVVRGALGRGEACLGPLRDERSLLLRKRREQVQDEGINVRAEVSDQERHPMNHQARDEMNITGQPVQLGDRDRATLPARFFKCGGELRLRQKLPRLEEALLG
jgi:hypothetical protein